MAVVMADLEWANDVRLHLRSCWNPHPKTDFLIRFLYFQEYQTMTINPGDSSTIPASTDPRLRRMHRHADESMGPHAQTS